MSVLVFGSTLMPRAHPIAPLSLGAGEKESLLKSANSRSLPFAIVQRAQSVLACSQGEPNNSVAQHLRLSAATVGKWRKRYLTTRHHHLVRRTGCRQWRSACPVQASPSAPGIPLVLAPHRCQRPTISRCASGRRQLRHPQTSQGQGLAGRTPERPHPLHPNLRLVDQSG